MTTIEIEKAIVRKLVRELTVAGFPPEQVWDGGAYVKTTTVDQVLEAVFAVDEATIHFTKDAKRHDGGRQNLGVFIVGGNGIDCISDWHVANQTFDRVVCKVADWIDERFPGGSL